MSIDAAKIGINGIVRISMRKHCPNWGKEWGERGALNKKRRLIFDCCLNITSSRCTIELQKQALLMMASCAVKPLLAGSTLILGYMHFCAKCHLVVTTTWSASSWCSIGLLAGEKKCKNGGISILNSFPATSFCKNASPTLLWLQKNIGRRREGKGSRRQKSREVGTKHFFFDALHLVWRLKLQQNPN